MNRNHALPKPGQGVRRLQRLALDKKNVITIDDNPAGKPNSRVRVSLHTKYADGYQSTTLYICGNPLKAQTFVKDGGKSLKDRTRRV